MNLDICNMAEDIKNMHTHYDMQQIGEDTIRQKDFLNFRKDFLQEEIDELNVAIDQNDADGVVDSIIDLLFVGITTLDLLGVDVNKAWKEVLVANMNKIAKENPTRPNKFGFPDLAKPDGWVAPNHIDNLGDMKDWTKNDK